MLILLHFFSVPLSRESLIVPIKDESFILASSTNSSTAIKGFSKRMSKSLILFSSVMFAFPISNAVVNAPEVLNTSFFKKCVKRVDFPVLCSPITKQPLFLTKYKAISNR